MTSSNRILNRIVIVIAALVVALAGATAIVIGLGKDARPAWLQGPLDAVGGRLVPIFAPTTTIADPVGEVPWAVVLTPVVALVLTILLLTFAFRRGGGAIGTVVHDQAGPSNTSVDKNVAKTVLAEPVGARDDVISARARVFRVKGTPAVDLVVTPRRGASLSKVVAAADESVALWDQLTDAPTPVVVRLAGKNLGDRLRSTARVQ